MRLLRKFLLKYVKNSVISQYRILTDVPYDVHENQHSDRDIAVGTENRTFLADNVDEISPSMLSRFFRYAFKDC